MARMVPFPMLPSDSSAERRLYEGFLEQLDESYVVYHSVDWVLAPRDRNSHPDEGEADFVVAHPEDGILAIEAKGGSLSYDPDTKRWSQSGRSGSHVLRKDPFAQAKGEIHSLVRILQAQPGFDGWRPSYGYAVAFPDGSYGRAAHPAAPSEIVIDRGDLERLAERIREVQGHWRGEGRVFGAEGMDALALALGYRVEIRTPLKLDFDKEDKKIVELTQDQAWILAYVMNRRRAAVSGPAGCGKTLLAIDVAKHLAQRGARTLLTCFNKALAAHLRESTAGIDGLHVVHFHGLCTTLAREAGLEVHAEEGADRAYFEETLPGLLEEAARLLGPRYDAMVVDEAQDLRAWWWPALLSLHEDPDGGTLYLFSDDHQNLYGGGELPVAEDAICPPLTANLRNTREISSFLSVFFEADEPPRARGPQGRPVEILGYETPDELARLLEVVLTNLVDEEEVPLEDIAVLTPAGKEKSVLRQRERFGRFQLSDRVEPNRVLWSSVHAFKGLERPVVILAELGDRHQEEIPGYLYAGGSRARNHLIVLAAEPVARDLRARAARGQ